MQENSTTTYNDTLPKKESTRTFDTTGSANSHNIFVSAYNMYGDTVLRGYEKPFLGRLFYQKAFQNFLLC
jgi:predicted N-acyltransferase